MSEGPKLLYIVVVDNDDGEKGANRNVSFRYTRPVLQSTLQLMGCKARHAFKVRTFFFFFKFSVSFFNLLPIAFYSRRFFLCFFFSLCFGLGLDLMNCLLVNLVQLVK